jgi:hypothetical protein
VVKTIYKRQSQVTNAQFSIFRPIAIGGLSFPIILAFRYKSDIMCLAARIISTIRDRARKNALGNINGLYDAIHVRSKFYFVDHSINDLLSSHV